MVEPAAARETGIWDLGPGDFLKLGFGAPEGLEEADLQVTGVHGLVLGEHIPVRRVMETETGSPLTRLCLWQEEGGLLAVARRVSRAEANTLFGPKRAGQLWSRQDDGDGPPKEVRRRQVPEGLRGWTGDRYWPDMEVRGRRFAADPNLEDLRRAGQSPRIARMQKEAFGFSRLLSGDGGHALEIHLQEGGRTEMFAVALLQGRHVEEVVRCQPVQAAEGGAHRSSASEGAGTKEAYDAFGPRPATGVVPLLEVFMALGLVGILVFGSVLLFRAASERVATNDIKNTVFSMVRNARREFPNSDFTGLSMDRLKGRGLVSGVDAVEMEPGGTATYRHAFGGEIGIWPRRNGFVVGLGSLDERACSALLEAVAMGRYGPGLGLVSVRVSRAPDGVFGDGEASPRAVLPSSGSVPGRRVTPFRNRSAVDAACSWDDESNNLYFEFRARA